MARVIVEGDNEAFDRISAALRSAGLSTVDVELVSGPGEVTQLPATPGSWAVYADMGTELSYADWRDEVLCLADSEEPATLRSALSLCETVTADLRRAG
jgi:hypothetical protein